MLVPGVFLLLLLLFCITIPPSHAGQDSCADCNDNGPWWPLFRPSQIIHSEFPEHQGAASARVGRQAVGGESAELRVDGVARPGAIRTSAPGLDRMVARHGGHRLQWDHYGVKVGARDAQVRERVEHEGSESHEGSFFNDGSFFDDTHKTKDASTKDFGDTRESAEAVSNLLDSREMAARRRPATSYSSFQSVFTGSRPPERRDLLHPDIPNDVFKYIHSPNPNAVSRSQHFNGRNMSLQYFVHEPNSGERPFVPRDHPVYRYMKSQGRSPLGQGQVRRVAHDVHIQHLPPSKNPVKESFWKSKRNGLHGYDFPKKDSFHMASWKYKDRDFQDRQDGFSTSPMDRFWKEPKKGFQLKQNPMKTSLSESYWRAETDDFKNRRDSFSASPVDPLWKNPGKVMLEVFPTQIVKHENFLVHQEMFSEGPSTNFPTDPTPNTEFKMDFELPSKDSFQDILRKESKPDLSYVPTKSPFFDKFWKNKDFYLNQAGSTKIPVGKDHKKIDLLKPSGQSLFFFKKKPNVLELKKTAFRRQGHGQNYDKRIVK